MSTASSTIRHTHKPSRSETLVVGKKTRDQLEGDWLDHFRKNNVPHGRPEGGWLTCQEMADKAGVDIQTMRRYLARNESLYERVIGTASTSSGARCITYYRLKNGRK